MQHNGTIYCEKKNKINKRWKNQAQEQAPALAQAQERTVGTGVGTGRHIDGHKIRSQPRLTTRNPARPPRIQPRIHQLVLSILSLWKEIPRDLRPLSWGGGSRLKELGNFQAPCIEVRGWCPRKQLNPGLDVHEPGDGVSKLCWFLRVCPPRRRVFLFFTASLLPGQSSVAFCCAKKKLHARSRPPPRSHTRLAITRSLQPDLEHSLIRKSPRLDQLKSIWKERASGPQKEHAGGGCYTRDWESFQIYQRHSRVRWLTPHRCTFGFISPWRVGQNHLVLVVGWEFGQAFSLPFVQLLGGRVGVGKAFNGHVHTIDLHFYWRCSFPVKKIRTRPSLPRPVKCNVHAFKSCMTSARFINGFIKSLKLCQVSAVQK